MCRVGQQPLIMVRGSDDKVRVLYNRCRHRANCMCHKDRDNAKEFVCPYHGWTYSIDGALVAPSFGKAYGSSLKQEDFALTPLERVESYRGLIFVSSAKEGIDLQNHLGKTKDFLIL